MKLLLFRATGVFLLAAAAFPEALSSVSGEVVIPSGKRQTELLFAELVQQGGPPVQRVDVVNGEFVFLQVNSGAYELRITNAHGDPIARDFVSLIGPIASTLRIRLPELKGERPVSGVVSVARLRLRPPRKAESEFSRASRAMEEHEWQRAAGYLRKALMLHPEYVEAHNNLGSCLMRMGNHQEAERGFRTALELDPSSSFAQANLATALYAQQRLDEAEQAARRALELDSVAPKSHYILGLILKARGKTPLETIEHFRRASGELPQAHVAAAQLLASLGNLDEARQELGLYLESDPPDRDRVKRWIANLVPRQGAR